MSKQTAPSTSPQPANRHHTEDTMRLALSRLASVKEHLKLRRDDDDPVQVLEDVIAEVLVARQINLENLSFMQQQVAKMQRR